MKILSCNNPLFQTDPKIYQLIKQEEKRQKEHLELIPSENYVSRAVLEAAGSVLTNKYAEGYPGKRYYHGNEFIDKIEQIAINRAKKLFGADHANVQPMSGALANMAAYEALLNPGDKVLSIELTQGGHLTHGSMVNFSGQKYRFYFYQVDKKSGQLDYSQIEKLALKIKPKLILAGTTAYPRKIDFKKFSLIARKAKAYFMADIAHIAGLVIAGLHPNPVPLADIVTTTTHKTLRGPRGAIILCKAEHIKAVDRAVFPRLQAGPLEHIIAAKGVCFKEAASASFRAYQRQIIKNAQVLAKSLMASGLKLTTAGTDNHLMVVDLTDLKLTGQTAADLLEQAGIIVNKNTIPFDPLAPAVTSGIRLGTPAITTRGMKGKEIAQIASWISQILHQQTKPTKTKPLVKRLCSKFLGGHESFHGRHCLICQS